MEALCQLEEGPIIFYKQICKSSESPEKCAQDTSGEISGGPVVRTPSFHCRTARGTGSIPGQGTKIPTRCAARPKNKLNKIKQ